ncbi:DUF6230 family protein [Streptomyces sp. SID10815]|uniref:DUF6230 family protein n=1 Tax=Streptomyces sp. SID10815 TaxID=2706027 RepID=UPI0013CDA35B|nr:DUF6230 family protein [Streptomyces sp. SID10815]NEA48090.1 cholesterol esterase [Streptomyces sp. SID10815]
MRLSDPLRGASARFAHLRSAGARQAADWNERMLAQAGDGTRRGTRWGRSALAAVPAAVAVGALGTALAGGALAAGFNITHQPFTLTSNGVSGTGFGAIVNTPAVGEADGTTSTRTGMTRVGFSQARLAGLCGIVHQRFAGVPYSLLLTAGQKVEEGSSGSFTPDIEAKNLYLQATDLGSRGATRLENTVIGQSADQVSVAGKPLSGAQPGAFGLGSAGGEGGASISLRGLVAQAHDAEIAGSMELPGLNLRVVPGSATSC